MYNNFFLILCGPTGTGKTNLSYELAKKYPIEIINCDIGQFYKQLSIGTAKPDLKDQYLPHHLFDVVAEPANFSVTEYRKRVHALLQEIWARNALPVIVGGSMFYIKALFFPPLNNQLENKKTKELTTSTSSVNYQEKIELWEKLFSIDPQRAFSIHKNDTYRVQRALELWHTSGGVLPSAYKPLFEPLARFHITFIVRDREELYERINTRVKNMFDEGWVEEVAGLSEAWRSFLMQKKVLGYPEIITCLTEEYSKKASGAIQACKENEKLVQSIQKKTRNYAKRQITFWQSLKREIMQATNEKKTLCPVISELNLTLSSINLYLESVQLILEHLLKENKENHE